MHIEICVVRDKGVGAGRCNDAVLQLLVSTREAVARGRKTGETMLVECGVASIGEVRRRNVASLLQCRGVQ